MGKKKHRLSAGILAGAAVFAAIILLLDIIRGRPPAIPIYHELDVGQGDAEVTELPGHAVFMTDAGPDGSVADAYGKALPGVKRIDLAVISHPQLDHFNGYNYLIERYAIGAFIINGRSDGPNVKEWSELLAKIREKHIPIITLGAGDSIHYGPASIRILSPDVEFVRSGELNDTGLVEYVSTTDWTALMTADTGNDVENALLAAAVPRADILKVGHHGSKYSTSGSFLTAIRPKAAVISVGRKNTYGHPAPSTLSRLSELKIPFFRTDEKGNIAIFRKGSALRIVSGK